MKLEFEDNQWQQVRRETEKIAPEVNWPEPPQHSTPPQYFERLPEQILNRVKSASVPIKSATRHQQNRPECKTRATKTLRHGIAASVLLLVVSGLALWSLLPEQSNAGSIVDTTTLATFLAEDLGNLDAQVLMDHVPETPTPITSEEAELLLDEYLSDILSEQLASIY